MSECVVWLSGDDIWGGNMDDFTLGSRFVSGLHFHVVRNLSQTSMSRRENVSRVANTGHMRVSATMDTWEEGGSRLNTGASLGVNLFAPQWGTNFTTEPAATTNFDGEVALTLAPYGRWADLAPWEHSVPDIQGWKVHEMFAFRSRPDAPNLYWLDDWERRETVTAVDVNVFGPDDNCALTLSRD